MERQHSAVSYQSAASELLSPRALDHLGHDEPMPGRPDAAAVTDLTAAMHGLVGASDAAAGGPPNDSAASSSSAAAAGTAAASQPGSMDGSPQQLPPGAGPALCSEGLEPLQQVPREAAEAVQPPTRAVHHASTASGISFGSMASEEDLIPGEGAATGVAGGSSTGGSEGSAAEAAPASASADQSHWAEAGTAASLGSIPATAADSGDEEEQCSMSEGEAALASEEEEEEEQDEEGGAAGEQLPDKLQPSELDLARLSSRSPADSEGASWDAWRHQDRHFFIITSAGKPVYSMVGDEDALAGFLAVIQAIVSVMHDQGDDIRSVSVGGTRIVFLLRGHLYFLAVSSLGEPVAALRRQLELLYSQVLFLVTTGIERRLQRSPGYDARQLLSGTHGILTSLLTSLAASPAYMLGAVEPAPMPPAERRVLSEALQDAVRASGALYGLVVTGRQVAALERGARSPPLHPQDLQLLANFVCANEQFRASEAFSPVCLPHFKPGAFCHVYVHCFSPEVHTYLLLVGASSDAFYVLSRARHDLEARLAGGAVLRWLCGGSGAAAGQQAALAVERLPRAAGGGAFGTTPLWHYLVRFPSRQQLLMPPWRPELGGEAERDALMRTYVRLHCTAYAQLYKSPASGAPGASGAGSGAAGAADGGEAAPGGGAAAAAAAAAAFMLPAAQPRPLKSLCVTTPQCVAACWPDREVEVYALLDPLADKEAGTILCAQLRRHIAQQAAEMLLASM